MIHHYAARRPVENAYLVRQRDQRRLRELLGVLIAVTALGAGLWTYTWMHTEILRTGYRVDNLDRQLHRLLEQERRLRLEAAYRAHPARVEKRASAELGMRAPQLAETLFYNELVERPEGVR